MFYSILPLISDHTHAYLPALQTMDILSVDR